jgi:hypothetical protein
MNEALPGNVTWPMSDYPINRLGTLSASLLGRPIVRGDDRAFVYVVRALLGKFGCPNADDPQQARWLVDKAIEKRVAAELGLPLR